MTPRYVEAPLNQKSLDGHIAGMDAFAKGLKVAHRLFTKTGYWKTSLPIDIELYRGIGKDIVDGKVGFKDLAEYAMENDQIVNQSGRQEYLEAIVNQYILEN